MIRRTNLTEYSHVLLQLQDIKKDLTAERKVRKQSEKRLKQHNKVIQQVVLTLQKEFEATRHYNDAHKFAYQSLKKLLKEDSNVIS